MQMMETLTLQVGDVTQVVNELRTFVNNLEAARHLGLNQPPHQNPRHQEPNPRPADPAQPDLGFRRQPRWDDGVKLDVGDFEGHVEPEKCLDWCERVERLMTWKQMPMNRQVEYAVLRLKGPALVLWVQPERTRYTLGLAPITTWVEFKLQLRKQYVPSDYLQTLYRRFHNLRPDKLSVDEYTHEFLVLQSRLDLHEEDDMTVSRYLNGLRYAIRDELELHDFRDLGEVSSRARKVEASLQKRTFGHMSTDRPSSSTTTAAPTPKNSDSPPHVTTGAPTPPTVLTRGHKSSECPRRHFVAITDSSDGHEPEYGVFLNDSKPEPEPESENVIEVEGEQAELLVCVLRYSLISSSETTERDFQRHAIFRTTARIQGYFCSIIIDNDSMEISEREKKSDRENISSARFFPIARLPLLADLHQSRHRRQKTPPAPATPLCPSTELLAHNDASLNLLRHQRPASLLHWLTLFPDPSPARNSIVLYCEAPVPDRHHRQNPHQSSSSLSISRAPSSLWPSTDRPLSRVPLFPPLCAQPGHCLPHKPMTCRASSKTTSGVEATACGGGGTTLVAGIEAVACNTET
ncbi:hypothetical protein KSP39_PZI001525 [Platanthera zijinensis]|uniref:Retrotransposon gag domain-containing protein n=1 Tax=Platanthera zijinensis TaxID=2320716 RepID=A0AAP0C219_9ASPA